MVTDTAKGEDGGATATVRRLANIPRGTFTVLAKNGISVGIGEKNLSAKKGEQIRLEGGVIQALLNDGSIEPV